MRLLAAVFIISLSLLNGTGICADSETRLGIYDDSMDLRKLVATSPDVIPTFSKVKLLRGDKASLSLAPVDADGVVVTLDNQGMVTGFDAADAGRVLWRAALAAEKRGDIYSAGLAYSNGVVVCAVDNVIYGLDPGTGQIIWESTFRNFLGGDLVIINEGRSVAVFTIDNYLYVFDVESGGLSWHRGEGGVGVRTRSLLSVAYSPERHYVVVVLPDGRVLCLDSYSGDKMWESMLDRRNMGFVGRIRVSPIVAGGEVFLSNELGALLSINIDTGEVTWSLDAGVRDISLVDEGSIYVVTDRGELLAFDSESKTRLWSISLPDMSRVRVTKWNSPVRIGDRLWILSSCGYLLGLNRFSGVVEESYVVPGSGDFVRSPVRVGNALYASGRKGLVVVW